MNQADDSGTTPLLVAIATKRVGFAKMLIHPHAGAGADASLRRNGADVHMKTKGGVSPMSLAQSLVRDGAKELTAVVELLEAQGATRETARTAQRQSDQASKDAIHEYTEFGSGALAVRASGITGAGLGTFARGLYVKGWLSEPYRCKLYVTGDPVEALRVHGGDTSKVWMINKTHSCSGSAYPYNNPICYVNAIAQKETCHLQNVEAVISRDTGSINPVRYRATRTIEPGEELVVDYGWRYFNGKDTPTYECKVRKLVSYE